jgi:hypothetical protein
MAMYSTEAVVVLVDTIYSAAADPAIWGMLLARLSSFDSGQIVSGLGGTCQRRQFSGL